jgi:hypothetical protein
LGKSLISRFGGDEMFRDRLVHWVGLLNFFTWTMGIMLVHAKSAQANLNIGPGRKWASSSQERNFGRNLAVQQAYNNLQSRLPVGR